MVMPKHPCLGMTIANPLPEGGRFAPSVIGFCSDRPHAIMGGRSGKPLLSGGREYAASRVYPPSAPGGGTGGVKEKGIARL